MAKVGASGDRIHGFFPEWATGCGSAAEEAAAVGAAVSAVAAMPNDGPHEFSRERNAVGVTLSADLAREIEGEVAAAGDGGAGDGDGGGGDGLVATTGLLAADATGGCGGFPWLDKPTAGGDTVEEGDGVGRSFCCCLLYTSPSPRD